MNYANQKLWDGWKSMQVDANGNPEPYGLECFNYAERWANAIEAAMANGASLEDVAWNTSLETANGITGFMHGMAVQILQKCWIHGEQLYAWHKAKWGE